MFVETFNRNLSEHKSKSATVERLLHEGKESLSKHPKRVSVTISETDQSYPHEPRYVSDLRNRKHTFQTTLLPQIGL